MRLLNVSTFEFEVFNREQDVPPYAIASHRWKAGEEAMLKDVQTKSNTDTSGFKKTQGFTKFITKHLPDVNWLWIDTCCVNQENPAEIDEAVNSMFRYYSEAHVCLVYLADVQDPSDEQQFKDSVWFRRGWTLQELVAPHLVVFLASDWQIIGHKGQPEIGVGFDTGTSLESQIAGITKIPKDILHDFAKSKRLTPEEKLAWSAGRETTKVEDMYYSLLGIFDIIMRLSYGEGAERARRRLLGKIAKQSDLFNDIVSWLSPPNPLSNHYTACEEHEPGTGEWLLNSEKYLKWKSGSIRHLWVHGKAGCGKTVLCSTLIEDIRRYCNTRPNSAYAMFYFSFSDRQKQAPADLLLSLVAQLGWREPACSTLVQAYKRPNRTVPETSELCEIALSAMKESDETFLILDALDECPEDGESRQSVLKQIKSISQNAPNCRILTTSRDAIDIRLSMLALKAEPVLISADEADSDIRLYVSKQLSEDDKLHRLDPKSKVSIQEHLSQKADGMFRWAYCQLQEVKKLKSTRPSYIKKTLENLPRSLDETYRRILARIDPNMRRDALVLLQWLAYALQPPTLAQLRDAVVIDFEGTGIGSVDFDDRGGFHDPIDILSDLVVLLESNDEINYIESSNEEGEEEDQDSPITAEVHSGYHDTSSRQQIRGNTRIRLAHFSVKEFLESDRMVALEDINHFQLIAAKGHGVINHSCLTYLISYSNFENKTLTKSDLERFPLLGYAAQSWYRHSSLSENNDISLEISFFTSEEATLDWIAIYGATFDWITTRHTEFGDRFSRHKYWKLHNSLYYASYFGLTKVVERLLKIVPSDITAAGGICGTPLAAASCMGHTPTVRLLLAHGAHIIAKIPDFNHYFEPALIGAASSGREEVVQVLLEYGADADADQGDGAYSALYVASFGGYERITRMLLEHGANVNFLSRNAKGTALHGACDRGRGQIVQLLLAHKADPNLVGRTHNTPLQCAVQTGREDIVRLLLAHGANANILYHQRKLYWPTPLHDAVRQGLEGIVRLLLSNGADVNALSLGAESPKTPLDVALSKQSETIAKLLKEAGGRTYRSMKRRRRSMERDRPS